MLKGRRIFFVALLIDLVAFLGFFVAAVLRYSANDIVPALSLKWELATALRGFFAWLPGLQFLGLAVALGSSKGKAEELVQSAILPTVILSAFLAAFALIAGPMVESGLSSFKAESASFASSLDALRSGIQSGELAKARAELGVCQAIAPNDPRLADAAAQLSAAEAKAKRDAAPLRPLEVPQAKDPAAAKDYYLKALDFSQKGDYFSANWYASTAVRLDPSYTDARRLAATSWEKMHERGSDPGDKDRAAFYGRKLEGYSLLRSGDVVGAYRVFRELADQKHGDDPDVRRYLAESLAQTEKSAFFKDEADDALAASLVPDVFFRVPEERKGAAAGPLRMIAAKDAAWSEGTLYFREFEYLEAGESGLRELVRSPYAKLSEGKLLLVCVERDRPANVYGPTWSAGPLSGPANVMDLSLSTESSYRALVARSRPATLSVLEAWRAASGAAAFGIDSGPILAELLSRTAVPFALFTSSALGALVGGRFRRRGGDFPAGLYALVPVMAAALVPVFLLAWRIDSLISAWALKMAPGLSSIALAAGIRTAVLFLAVILMAGVRDVDGDEID
jgi:hypothetical protein